MSNFVGYNSLNGKSVKSTHKIWKLYRISFT